MDEEGGGATGFRYSLPLLFVLSLEFACGSPLLPYQSKTLLSKTPFTSVSLHASFLNDCVNASALPPMLLTQELTSIGNRFHFPRRANLADSSSRCPSPLPPAHLPLPSSLALMSRMLCLLLLLALAGVGHGQLRKLTRPEGQSAISTTLTE